MNDPLGDATTLNEVLEKRVQLSGTREWLTLYSKNKIECKLTLTDLLEGASAWAAHLSKIGAGPGERVLQVLSTEKAFYESYWGILLAGAVPVPAYPPAHLGRMAEYLENLARLSENCGAKVMITNRRVRPLVSPVQQAMGNDFRFVVPEEIQFGVSHAMVPVSGSDLALLQYTSGSTGNQKGVMLSHNNLLANIRAIGNWLKFKSDEVAVSWLPLYHDMGLIGLMICTLYWDVPVIAMSPLDFLRDPSRWFRVISDHRGTLSAAPNFAYSLSARKVRPASVGKPIEYVEVRVVDEDNRQIDEGYLGEVLVRGPSVMEGYFGKPEETAKAINEGWLYTGDHGFILDGNLYIAGRKKDLIIQAGRNYFAEDVETAASGVKGVRPGGLCAIAVENPDRGTEDMVLVAEVSKGADQSGLSDRLKTEVCDKTGCRPDQIVLVPPRSLPKTSSGKLQRFKTKALYLDGTIHSRGITGRCTSGLSTYIKTWLFDKLKWVRRR